MLFKRKFYFLIYAAIVLFLTFNLTSCDDYLDEKTDFTLIIPETLDDLQLIMNYWAVMNNSTPDMAVKAADNFTMTWASFNTWTSSQGKYKAVYSWDPNAETSWRWTPILYANTVLEQIEGITPTNEVEQIKWNTVKGRALFFRAFHFFKFAEIFSLPYDEITASTDLGIPLRMTSDVNVITKRSTVQETYDNIINSLNEAILLLPEEIEHQSQPSKAAAYALLSNVYLSMRNYPLALENATNCLNIQNELLDYNALPPAIPYGDPVFEQYGNPEVLFHHRMDSGIGYLEARGMVDMDLYNSYEADDLRPDIFFAFYSDSKGSGYQMWENYGGNYYEFFDGLAVDEVYLTRAECYARSGNIDMAFNDLNNLLEKRYATGTFTLYDPADFTTVTATQLVLQERRKELIFRGIRWSDIRRLNKENDPNYAVGPLVRTFEGSTETFTLPVNDLRYAFLIPQESIDKSGLQQNPR